MTFSISARVSSRDPYINTRSRDAGADPGFQGRGGHLNKLRRAEGGAKMFGVFRVKNHDFTSKNHIFPILEGHVFYTSKVEMHWVQVITNEAPPYTLIYIIYMTITILFICR